MYDPETVCGSGVQCEVWYGRQSFVGQRKERDIKKGINKWPSNTAVSYNINIVTCFDLLRSLSALSTLEYFKKSTQITFNVLKLA